MQQSLLCLVIDSYFEVHHMLIGPKSHGLSSSSNSIDGDPTEHNSTIHMHNCFKVAGEEGEAMDGLPCLMPPQHASETTSDPNASGPSEAGNFTFVTRYGEGAIRGFCVWLTMPFLLKAFQYPGKEEAFLWLNLRNLKLRVPDRPNGFC